MRTLVFTHSADIDGMGGAVLAHLAFGKDVKVILCEGFELDKVFDTQLKSNRIYTYDKIYFVDLTPGPEVLDIINSNQKLHKKTLIFDHHVSVLDFAPSGKYDFLTLKIKKSHGLCSGTSLFYEYLIKQKLLDIKAKNIADYVELTRQYDTWEWKTKYHNEKPHDLTLLFDTLSAKNFIKSMVAKLSQSDPNFKFNETEKALISSKKSAVLARLKKYSEHIIPCLVQGLKAGVIFIDYEYRNDIAEYTREQNSDLDFLALIALDNNSISFRSLKSNVSVRKIAESLGGRGHDHAAGAHISPTQLSQIIDLIL
jgi:oligoribonuclease NrnB/cAMP/cGMP phosphodiesterase (DHH superfamily)